jgi:hypothetical protein
MGSRQSAEEERKNYEMQLEQEWAKRQRCNISVSMRHEEIQISMYLLE